MIRLTTAGLSLAFLTISAGCALQQDGPDSCTSLVPASLQEQLSEEAPDQLDYGETREEDPKPAELAIAAGRSLLNASQLGAKERKMATALERAGEVDLSRKVLLCLADRDAEVYGEDSLEVAATHVELARLSLLQSDWPRWSRLGRFWSQGTVADEIVKKVKGEYSKEHGDYLFTMAAILYYADGHPSGVEWLYREALKVYRRALGPEDPSVGLAAYELGALLWPRAYYSKSDADEAEEYLRLALNIFEKSPDLDDWVPKSRARLMFTYAASEQKEAALQQCLLLRQSTHVPTIQDVKGDPLPIVRVRPMPHLSLARPRIEGRVVIGFDLDELGSTRNIRTVEIDGPEVIADAAEAAIKYWKFSPRCDGQQLLTTEDMETELIFRMDD